MATDLAPSAEAEFTSVIQAPDDGDPLNAAAIINMLLPIINRTEFLNAGLVTEPWKGSEVYDDFTLASLDSGGTILHTGHSNWFYQTSGSATHTLFTPAVDADTTGVLRDSVGGAATGNWRIRQAFDQFRFSQLRQIDLRIAFEDVASLSGRIFEAGLIRQSSIGARNLSTDDAVSLLYDDDEGAGWYLRTVNAGSESVIAVPSSTMTDGVFGNLTLLHDGAGVWVASFDGGDTATAVGNLPPQTDTATCQIKYEVPSTGDRDFDLDYIRFRFATSGRQF